MDNPPEKLFRVLPRQADTTIAAALRGWLPGESWSRIRGLLKSRRVMISGNICIDPARRLTVKDVIKILEQSAPAPPREEDVRIVYVDAHVVVVEKPSGMTTTRHAEERDWPARHKQLQPTLDELLPRVLENREKRNKRGSQGKTSDHSGKARLRPVRAVHRIDRDTSGLLVFARTATAERQLSQQFRHHTTHRRYLAIALGAVKAETIESRLIRDRGDGRRGSTRLPEVGKRSVTHVLPLEDLGDYTLVECRLETGRTHQIRIHLAERGHPLCGEKVYNQRLYGPPIPDTSGAPRLALHAAELGFVHPVTGEELRFEMPLPEDLAQFLKQLRKATKRAKTKGEEE
jgi:23S rRNA pseudouridine1911/1915/1917 synthase